MPSCMASVDNCLKNTFRRHSPCAARCSYQHVHIQLMVRLQGMQAAGPWIHAMLVLLLLLVLHRPQITPAGCRQSQSRLREPKLNS